MLIALDRFMPGAGLPADWAEKEEGKSGAARKVGDAVKMVSRPLAEVQSQQLGQLASPRAAKEPVSRQQAADALGRIMGTIDQAPAAMARPRCRHSACRRSKRFRWTR